MFQQSKQVTVGNIQWYTNTKIRILKTNFIILFLPFSFFLLGLFPCHYHKSSNGFNLILLVCLCVRVCVCVRTHITVGPHRQKKTLYLSLTHLFFLCSVTLALHQQVSSHKVKKFWFFTTCFVRVEVVCLYHAHKRWKKQPRPTTKHTDTTTATIQTSPPTATKKKKKKKSSPHRFLVLISKPPENWS